jgi:GMP synthase-like glutamine amidotransferase
MRLHCLRHVPFEDSAYIGTWAKARGHTVTETLLFKGEELPLLSSFDLLVIMGGPMSTCDEAQYPWLKAEKRFIRMAVATGKLVLGVCLGAQLIAEALGGKVSKNKFNEIGWLPVKMTPEAKTSPMFGSMPEEVAAFQWHGDTFTIPPGAKKLASGEACENQAFEIGRTIGLQFHLESTKESIELLIENCGQDLSGGKYVQDAEHIRAGYGNLPEANRLMETLLDNMEKVYTIVPE